MGLAAQGYVKHRVSMHLCQATLIGNLSSRIQTMSSWAFLCLVCDRFDKDMARCTWPYHLSRRQLRIDVISSIPSFCSSEADGVSSLSWCYRCNRSWHGHCGPPIHSTTRFLISTGVISTDHRLRWQHPAKGPSALTKLTQRDLQYQHRHQQRWQ